MSDLISRQAAIDALRTCYDTETVTMSNGDEYINYEDAVGEIEQLPSVQPEERTEKRMETHACDLISRQAAIDALNEYFARIGRLKRRGLNEGEKAISLDTVGIIKTLPSVQPEPSIPLSWIEKHIEWHKSLDNIFAELIISGMVKKWRDEQGESN